MGQPEDDDPGDTANVESGQADVAVKKKTSTQKDTISLLRQEQIQEYKRKVTREERMKRYALRHGDTSDRDTCSRSSDGISDDGESPRKKKRVSFDFSKREVTPPNSQSDSVSPKRAADSPGEEKRKEQ